MGKLNLEPEVKSGFLVDKERKKIWNVELDMLEKVIDICERNDIKYFAAGGTLLGAVRHQGFIPWDDDIDLAMKREDYNKFLKIAEKEFKYPYFVQYYKTEKGYWRGHAQIRNSNTTAIIRNDDENDFNKGIFIDIFPIDNVPDDLEEREKFLKKMEKIKSIQIRLYHYKKGPNKLKNVIKLILSKLYCNFTNEQKNIEKFENVAHKYNDIKTKQSGTITFRTREFKYDNEWFDECIKLNFEYLKLKAPKQYDKLLTRQYGDYMKIPKNKNESVHGTVFFDTEKSYKEYEKDIDRIVERLKREM